MPKKWQEMLKRAANTLEKVEQFASSLDKADRPNATTVAQAANILKSVSVTAENVISKATDSQPEVANRILSSVVEGVKGIDDLAFSTKPVTTRLAKLIEAADNVTAVALDKNVTVETKAMFGVARALEGIGSVTPNEDFVTQAVGHLMGRINTIVAVAKSNIDTEATVKTCAAEGVGAIIDFTGSIVFGVRYLHAKNAIKPALIENSTNDTDSRLSALNSYNYTQDLIASAPASVSVNLIKAARATVDKMFGNIELNDDGNALIMELVENYKLNQNLIANVSGGALLFGATHLIASMEFNAPTLLALAAFVGLHNNIPENLIPFVTASLTIAMILKDNVTPGALIMLAAWMALVPTLLSSQELEARIPRRNQITARP